MNPGLAPVKTGQGRAEVAARGRVLTPVQRRLLILVDGRKTVNDLGAFVRVGELESALQGLLGLGVIAAPGPVAPLPEPAGPGFVAASAGSAERAATSPQEFGSVRALASAYVREQLGGAGESICAAIDRCSSPHELRKLLRGIEVFVGQRLDRERAQAFARHFGRLLL